MGCCGSRLVTASDEIETDDIVVAEDGQVHAENADTAVKLSIDVNPSTNEVSIVGASKDFHLKYTLGDVIGKGGYSIVHKAVLKATGVEYAVKCIQRDKLDSEDLARMAAEVNALAQLKHPNIIQLFDFFEEEHFYYIVTEYMEGGELFQRLIEKTYYTQQDAKNVVRTLLETIKFCHDKGIAHRDLKVCTTSVAKGHQTTLYLAPEILKIGTPYGKECDIWSIGVITFMLLSGCPPFYDENVAVLYDKIKAGSYQYDPYYWKHVSNEAKHLISLMLQVDPSKRYERVVSCKVQLAVALHKRPSTPQSLPARHEESTDAKTTSVVDDEWEVDSDLSSPAASISSSVFESYHFTRDAIDPRDGWSSEFTAVSADISNEDEWL
ncbi:hypothetical protein DYB32_008274 [Aphanomyces invadans]|uniref:non-specific serine/threonine protein kinase n=1 Tax=Aphanomyces invadans TaxID=157072 RepID=A0A3R6VGY1_9STRA|nr:hypothetical protein DYB32_008274 [Aphanomyces invadans]